jgi:diphthamide synthase (EF-2-diphthine--ammonia ligase)
MAAAVAQARAEGVFHMAFGDLFLEDIRRYREEKLGAVGVTPVFPIWGLPTAALAREMVAAGLRAYLTCVDPKKLDRSFAGRLFDHQLLDELPAAIDPCGENGEFHSFAFAGPMFSHPVGAKSGQIVERDGFVFADVLGECAAPSLP